MSLESYKNIMVYADVIGQKISDNSLKLLGEAKRLAKQFENYTKVYAVIIGKDVKKVSRELIDFGADMALVFEDEKLEYFRPDMYSEALTEVIEKYRPEIVLVGDTCQGEELGLIVAKKLDTGMIAHCVELKINEKLKFVQIIPAFGGRSIKR